MPGGSGAVCRAGAVLCHSDGNHAAHSRGGHRTGERIGQRWRFSGPTIMGILKSRTHGITFPFGVLGSALLVAAALCFFLPKSKTAAGAGGQV